MIIMAVVDQWMPPVQHTYRGVAVTMQQRRTGAGSHAQDELSEQEKSKKNIKSK